MLALILLACNGPTRERSICAEDVAGYLFVRAYDELVAGPDPEARCARTQTQTQGYVGYDDVPFDLALTLNTYQEGADTELSTIAGLLDGFPSVGLGPDFTRVVYEFGTRHGQVFPTDEQRQVEGFREPVQPEEGLTSTVVTPLGVEVVGRGPGLVAENPNPIGVELVVRCSDCDVYVPYAATRLRLELERASLHLCYDGIRTHEGRLTDTVVHAQEVDQPGEPFSRVVRVEGSLVIESAFQGLPGLLDDGGVRQVPGGGLCR